MSTIFRRHIKKVGGTLYVTIPAPIRHQLDLYHKQPCIFEVSRNAIIITPIKNNQSEEHNNEQAS